MFNLLLNKKLLLIATYFLLFFTIICYRITIGVSFSDESYYVAFIDNWLKSGFKNSSNLMIHQTAAWLVYPFAGMYTWIIGGEEGILLFLRTLYVALSCWATMCFFAFSKRIYPLFITTLVSGFLFSFMPWSLPTISYNTIGMLGFLITLCLFGIIILDSKKHTKWFLLNVSSFFAAVAIISYPTLLLSWVFFIACAYFRLSERQLLLKYLLFAMIYLGVLIILLCFTLGFQHLISMITFTNIANEVSNGFSRKWALLKFYLFTNKKFLILLMSALVLSSLKIIFYSRYRFIFQWINYFFLAIIICFCSFFSNHVLFLNSHDLVLILAISAYIPLHTYPPIVVIMYWTSILAGCITTFTAYNSLYNFHVGGFLAACLSLLFLMSPQLVRLKIYHHVIICLLLVGASFVNFKSEFQYIYEETYNPLKDSLVRIKNGPYAGLQTSESKAKIVYGMQEFLPQNIYGKNIVVFGHNSIPGYLLTSLSPKTLFHWPWGTSQQEKLQKKISDYYAINHPDFIFKITDNLNLYSNQIEQTLLNDYHLTKEKKISNYRFELYQRNNFL